MNENLYIAHKKRPHKTLRVHSTRYTQCIHVTCKLSQAKHYQRTLIPVKYQQPIPTHPFPKVQLYIAVKCKNIHRVTNNDNRKKTHTHTHTHTHTLTHRQAGSVRHILKDTKQQREGRQRDTHRDMTDTDLCFLMRVRLT